MKKKKSTFTIALMSSYLFAIAFLFVSCTSNDADENSYLPTIPGCGSHNDVLLESGEAIPAPSISHLCISRAQMRAAKVKLALSDANEIWIIEKPKEWEVSKRYENTQRADLVAEIPGTKKYVPIPLKHTAVKGKISGYAAQVEVEQQYLNPFKEKIEATYIFPLPQNAAVTDFIMTVGERKIRGVIREKEEAKKIYNEAKRQGYVASMMTQERPNMFTQKVANIEPGKEIDISVTYFNTLKFEEGEYEFVFPMVVGPRFNPPGNTDGIGTAAYGKSVDSPQKVCVEYLAPNERSGNDISLSLDIDAGINIEELSSPTHAIKRDLNGRKAEVSLKKCDSIPNRDFVLRYKVAGKKLKAAFMCDKSDIGNTFSFMLMPPESIKNIPKQPREMIFVVDCSGSMSGAPMDKAKDAMRPELFIDLK